MTYMRTSTTDDLAIIAKTMRPSETAAIAACSGFTPLEAITQSFDESIWSRTIDHDGKPVCMFGLVILEGSSGYAGYAWMLASHGFNSCRRFLLKNTKLLINEMFQYVDSLHAIVDSRYEKTKRWMYWAGFDMTSGPHFFLNPDVPFWAFELTKKNFEALQWAKQ